MNGFVFAGLLLSAFGSVASAIGSSDLYWTPKEGKNARARADGDPESRSTIRHRGNIAARSKWRDKFTLFGVSGGALGSVGALVAFCITGG